LAIIEGMDDMDLKQRLAIHIKEIMDLRGMTQAQLSVASGVAQPNISRILNAKDDVRSSTIEKLAAGLAVDPAFLLVDAKPVLAESA
jgi:transcriptional regulator with XRE-family HTH domain